MLVRRWMLPVLLALLAACGGSTGTPADDGAPDVPDVPLDGTDGVDAPADVAFEVADDVLPDAATDAATDSATDAPDDALPEGIAWAGSPAFPLDGAFYAAHPEAFARTSRYATHVSGPLAQRPNVGHRGSFGVGNGSVFGFVGLADPLNTLHSLVGPTYERRKNFFGDWSVRLLRAQDATPPDFDEEWAGRSLSAPVVMTRGRLGDLELDTIDVADPVGAGHAPSRCLLRLLLVRNRGATASEALDLVVVPTNVVTPEANGLTELQAASGGRVRRLAVQFQGSDGALARFEAGRLVLGLEAVAPGSESLHVLSFCTDDVAEAEAGTAPGAGWFDGDPGLVVQAVLDAAADRYVAWESGTVQIDVPDPMVADFLDGMKMTLKVQTASTGATCPMSQYTRTWARDNIGSVMAMLAFGALEDVEAMLDYVYAAIRYSGDLLNSYDADLVVADAAPPPDWAAMGPLSARVAAETPSYMVRMYGLHHRYSGDLARATQRWGLVRRCLFAQGFGPDRLLPFTGDETYRAAMNYATGLFLEHPHQDLTWSANSTYLFLGAAREFMRLAEALGRPAEVEEARVLAAEVETVSVPHFNLDDGCVAAFVDRDTLLKSLPFEDVALQVTWSGWKDGDDAFAQSSLDCLVKRLGRDPGEIVSRPDPIYEGTFDVWEGIYTGMLPGYTLSAMTDMVHPQAADAFNVVRKSLDTSGNLQEYMIYDDHSGLSPGYDPQGALGDYTTKFRPWEGGIVAEAVMRYLVGFSPDASSRNVSLRPHLPAGWPRMAFAGLRAGGERFDVAVERIGEGEARVTIARLAGSLDAEAWRVNLRWDAPSGQPSFLVGDVAVPEADLQRFTTLFQTVSARTPAVDLVPGATVTFTVKAIGF